jgi:hypothetical protein
MILAIGSAVDLTKPSIQPAYSEAFHHLARAAISERPLVDEPDFDLLHSLIFMVWYYLIFCDNNKSVGYAWNMIGFVIKMAQGVSSSSSLSLPSLITLVSSSECVCFISSLYLFKGSQNVHV